MTISTHNKPTAVNPQETGYGKPPANHRFQKGRSGNPNGRPKKQRSTPKPLKLADGPSNSQFEQEIYRLLQLHENGKPVELPASQALLRSMVATALKGNRLAQKQLYELLKAEEQKAFEQTIKQYSHYADLKAKHEAIIAKARAQGLPEPELYPHPDDILLDPTTAKVKIIGPRNPDQVPIFKNGLIVWEYFLTLSAYLFVTNDKLEIEIGGIKGCAAYAMTVLVQLFLPPRMRVDQKAEEALHYDLLHMTKKELSARMRALINKLSHAPTISAQMNAHDNAVSLLGQFGDGMMEAVEMYEKQKKK